MIAETLAAYSAACERATIENRPTAWAIHFDIWNENQGEIGLVHSNDGQANAAFAALVPFVLVPQIGTSILVLDFCDLKHRELAVTELTVVGSEIESHHCHVPFGVGDNGSMDFANVENEGSPFVSFQVLAMLDTVIDARQKRFGWDEYFSFDDSVRVATEFVRRLAV